MSKQFNKPEFGSVSSGTMQPRDLIPAFLDCLEYFNNNKHAYKALIKEGKRIIQKGDFESEDASYYLDELLDALNSFALPYTYFGSHSGDGADYGFWVDEYIDSDFDGLRVEDLIDVPKGYSGDVLFINDHGNMTLYSCTKGRMREIWSVV